MPSQAVRGISWDADTLTLFVQFVSGETYAYLRVPGEVFDAFRGAFSKGRFFQAEIRDRYAYRRIEAGGLSLPPPPPDLEPA